MKKPLSFRHFLLGCCSLLLLGCDQTEDAPAPDLSALYGKWKVSSRETFYYSIVHSTPTPGVQPPQNKIIIGYKVFPGRIPVGDSTYWHFFENGTLQLNDTYVATVRDTSYGFPDGGVLQDGLNPDSVYSGSDSVRAPYLGKRQLQWKFSGNLLRLLTYKDQFHIEKLTPDSLVLLYPETNNPPLDLPKHPYRARIRFARWN